MTKTKINDLENGKIIAREMTEEERRLWYRKGLIERAGIYGMTSESAEHFLNISKEDFEKTKKLEKKIDASKFKEIGSKELLNILGSTIKKDDTNKIVNFLAQLSAYTDDAQMNLLHSSPSSTGKSYIPMETSSLFPRCDVISVGYCSPTSFFHDTGLWDKENKCYIVDLSKKILIFLDQPHTLLLQHLRPVLSHDKKEIEIKITDKSMKHGLKTKKVIIRGYPVVIFCTAGLKLDEQEATRFLLLSPETSQDKLKEGIILKIDFEADKVKFRKNLNQDAERNLLKERILEIKQEQIEQIIINDELKESLKAKFLENKTLKPRHQRDIGRLISLIKTFTLLNVWFRKREGNVIYSNQSDYNEAWKIWKEISESQELNLPPYVFSIYKEVIVKKCSELKGGITRQEILKGYCEVYGRVLQDWLLRQQILPMLENCGLIVSEQDAKDKRKILYTPTTLLTLSQNYSESAGGGSKNKVCEHLNVLSENKSFIFCPDCEKRWSKE